MTIRDYMDGLVSMGTTKLNPESFEWEGNKYVLIIDVPESEHEALLRQAKIEDLGFAFVFTGTAKSTVIDVDNSFMRTVLLDYPEMNTLFVLFDSEDESYTFFKIQQDTKAD